MGWADENACMIGVLARVCKYVHTWNMRTNVNIADDAREFAEYFAHANGITLGEAITELIRKSQNGGAGTQKRYRFGRSESGFPTFPRSGRKITTEMVLEAQANDLD